MCFNGLVGFKPNTCVNVDLPSKSGFYLEDSEHGIILKKFNDTKLVELQNEASIDLKTLLLMRIESQKIGIIPEHLIGVGLDSNYYEYRGEHLGWFIMGKIHKGVSAVVKNISLNINSVGTYTFKIINSSSKEIIDTFDIVVDEVKSDKKYPVNKELVFSDIAGNMISYYIMFEANGANVGNNTIKCNCPGRTFEHSGLLEVSGVRTNDLSFTNFSVNNSAHGIQMHIEMKCDPLGIICTAPDSFFNNSFGLLLAKAQQLTWAIKVISYILNSNEINTFTYMSREELYGKRNHYSKLRDDILTTMLTEIPSGLSHCYQCRNRTGFSKQTI